VRWSASRDARLPVERRLLDIAAPAAVNSAQWTKRRGFYAKHCNQQLPVATGGYPTLTARFPPSLSTKEFIWPASCNESVCIVTVLGRSRTAGGHQIRVGDKVRFQVADIFLPTRDDLPQVLATALELEGTVTDFSDSGPQPCVFAVVDVIAHHNVVLPVNKLKFPGPSEPSGRTEPQAS
jgi:hypothetical protein